RAWPTRPSATGRRAPRSRRTASTSSSATWWRRTFRCSAWVAAPSRTPAGASPSREARRRSGSPTSKRHCLVPAKDDLRVTTRRYAVDNGPDPRDVIRVAAPVCTLIRAQPRERGLDGGGRELHPEVRRHRSLWMAQTEQPVEHKISRDLLEV